ncbi:hypothetical protein TNCV_614331 [Trichonephila clavipes]|nr:hypothetical protein TNCV_614331 [Trichonephila clavipes]
MATSTNKTAAYRVKLIHKCMSTPLHLEKLDCLVRFMGWWNPSSKTMNGDQYRAMITNFFIPELNNHDVRWWSCGSNKTAQHVPQLVPHRFIARRW